MSEEVFNNRYVIKRQLAKKAGRRTLLALDRITNQRVIIKSLTFGNDFAWEDLKLFEREAETLKTLSHPSIPGYIDYFELDTTSKSYALVQTYVDGQSLEEYIQSGRVFTESELKNIAVQILELLVYLHSQHPPVIHRDIKPSNIIFQENQQHQINQIGKVYLVDFGSVQTLASKAGKTVTVVGTYGYMPPEQFGGYAIPGSDLYSLGATLIALGTGIHPADLPQKEMKIDFERLVNFSPKFVEWLQWLIEPNQEKRVESASVALDALENNQGWVNLTRRSPTYSATEVKVNTLWLFFYAIILTTLFGGGIVAVCGGLYGTIFIPVIGTVIGGMLAGFLGFPLGFALGIINGLITRFFFYPLRNTNLHKRVLNLTSITISVAVAIIYFRNMIMISTFSLGSESSGGDSYNLTVKYIVLNIVAPSVITALGMGATSKSFAQWYEEESRTTKYLEDKSKI